MTTPAYTSDLTDAQWQRLAPVIPPGKSGVRRKTGAIERLRGAPPPGASRTVKSASFSPMHPAAGTPFSTVPSTCRRDGWPTRSGDGRRVSQRQCILPLRENWRGRCWRGHSRRTCPRGGWSRTRSTATTGRCGDGCTSRSAPMSSGWRAVTWFGRARRGRRNGSSRRLPRCRRSTCSGGRRREQRAARLQLGGDPPPVRLAGGLGTGRTRASLPERPGGGCLLSGVRTERDHRGSTGTGGREALDDRDGVRACQGRSGVGGVRGATMSGTAPPYHARAAGGCLSGSHADVRGEGGGKGGGSPGVIPLTVSEVRL